MRIVNKALVAVRVERPAGKSKGGIYLPFSMQDGYDPSAICTGEVYAVPGAIEFTHVVSGSRRDFPEGSHSFADDGMGNWMATVPMEHPLDPGDTVYFYKLKWDDLEKSGKLIGYKGMNIAFMDVTNIMFAQKGGDWLPMPGRVFVRRDPPKQNSTGLIHLPDTERDTGTVVACGAHPMGRRHFIEPGTRVGFNPAMGAEQDMPDGTVALVFRHSGILYAMDAEWDSMAAQVRESGRKGGAA